MPRATSAATAGRQHVDAVREFNRFYTRHLGLLDQAHLHSPFPLAAVRVLYELAHWDETHGAPPTATAIGSALNLDAGYLSRLLRDFTTRQLIKRVKAPDDARQQHLRLTAAGRTAFAELNARAHDAVAQVLAPLDERSRTALVEAMGSVQRMLQPAADRRASIVVRPPRPGDYGWIVMRHGELYAQEYGWDQRFENLVARVVADFAGTLDAARERCWIAEVDGVRAGTVTLLAHRERPGVAQLRLLLVEPSARGLGIGRRLVDECTTFARAVGYHTITLWTNSVLTAARRIYQAAGYRLVEERTHTMFGPKLVGQTWELRL